MMQINIIYYKPTPDVTMGFGSKFLYKNWDLGFTMRASLGNYVYNHNLAASMNVGKGSVYQLAYLGNRLTEAVAIGITTLKQIRFTLITSFKTLVS